MLKFSFLLLGFLFTSNLYALDIIDPKEFNCRVDKVIDGDTIDATCNLGFNLFVEERFRFYGVDTPETRTLDGDEKRRGLEATEYVRGRVEGKEVVLHTEEKGKFGRWLVKVFDLEGKCVNDELIEKGLGREYFGGRR